MEYQEHQHVRTYRPLFGYGYDPDQIEEERKKKREQDSALHRQHGMPRPLGSPTAALIAAIIVLLALLAGALFASQAETQIFAEHWIHVLS